MWMENQKKKVLPGDRGAVYYFTSRRLWSEGSGDGMGRVDEETGCPSGSGNTRTRWCPSREVVGLPTEDSGSSLSSSCLDRRVEKRTPGRNKNPEVGPRDHDYRGPVSTLTGTRFRPGNGSTDSTARTTLVEVPEYPLRGSPRTP